MNIFVESNTSGHFQITKFHRNLMKLSVISIVYYLETTSRLQSTNITNDVHPCMVPICHSKSNSVGKSNTYQMLHRSRTIIPQQTTNNRIY